MIFDPQQIEAELERIQRQNSPTEARTTILNLVVFSRRETTDRTEAALAHVVGKRAARVIHVVPQDRPESNVSLSARCYLDRESKSVCVQEIVIENGADGVGAAPGTWTPLLIRDLPVYAIWFDTLSKNTALLQDLEEQCDTLIVDSEQCVAFGETVPDIVRTITSELVSRGVVVSDFVWQRLLPLRQVTARYFDPPERRERLERIRSVTVSGAPPVFAGLYLSWLAARLDWYVEPNRVADHTGGDVAVTLLTAEGESAATGRKSSPSAADGMNVPTGQAAEVHFTFDDGDAVTISGRNDGTATIARTDGRESARDGLAAGDTVQRSATGYEEVVSYGIPSDGEIVIAEIDAVRNENLYTEALAVLGRAPWAP
ncbi:MAG: glucose-6-phosphate dehydrogenase assembly protein OpcA [Spirochaetaceae bacterium]